MAGIHKLTDAKIRSGLKVGRHGDGGGLYLEAAPGGTKSWLFMWKVSGRRRAMGLGSYPTVTLASARAKAAKAKADVAEGRDPVASQRKAQGNPTFAQTVDDFLAANSPAWRNSKHRDQWAMTLGDTYCKPIRSKPVDGITVDDVLKILSPIWTSKNETASRLRGRIERVLDFAKVKGWRDGLNPALWNGNLQHLLPARQKLQRGHHPALPYKDLPAFMAELRTRGALAALALEFLILTAARSGEVYGATWNEFDLGIGVWTIPAARMKAAREHVVPLSKAALSIMQSLHEVRSGPYVFPGQRPSRPLSSSAMEMLLRRMNRDAYTVHGFRSSFRDWAGDETDYPRDLIETALAHTVGDATERAYRRSTAQAKRLALLEDWARYCRWGAA
ncbi:integrase [Pararhizobium capsulatum DSM 1112]|uniref:Integrase n=1 Tax=Pararhizobium capsulatum DSM 1112 TaxID=1121113 RepID=A0ABU0BN74_9HYPH|nr:site-specific integrase [Pararhizobium capsulatum]MDQ0319698.1 integrase [Pararhizobium capsulatum DSM 1112]